MLNCSNCNDEIESGVGETCEDCGEIDLCADCIDHDMHDNEPFYGDEECLDLDDEDEDEE